MENELKIITKRLQNYRKLCGVTQVEVAEELKISKQCISLFECGGLNNMKMFIYYVTNFVPYKDTQSFIDECCTLAYNNTSRGGNISWRF